MRSGEYCTSSCKPNEYADNTFKDVLQQEIFCYLCDISCNNCSGSSSFDCKDCAQSYFKFNGQCREDCPIGTFYNFTINSCSGKVAKISKIKTFLKACNSICEECLDSVNCTKCLSGFAVSNGKCSTNQCQDGYVWNSSCLNCSRGCKTCYNFNNCTDCFAPYVSDINNGNCSLCNSSSYFDYSTKSCFNCSQNCTTCTNSTHCLNCSDGYFALINSDSNFECLNPCPEGFYNDNNLTCVGNNIFFLININY